MLGRWGQDCMKGVSCQPQKDTHVQLSVSMVYVYSWTESSVKATPNPQWSRAGRYNKLTRLQMRLTQQPQRDTPRLDQNLAAHHQPQALLAHTGP